MNSRIFLLAFILLIIAPFSGCDEDTLEPCNGFEQLCDVRLDELSVAMTHNSHAYRPVFLDISANQNRDISTQLMEGIRGINVKVYLTDDANCGPSGLYVYHEFPGTGCEPFSKVLGEIKDFLDANPREVLFMTIEGSAAMADMAQAFTDEGMDNFLLTQQLGGVYPTLGELISSNRRLMVLTDRENSSDFPGFHHMWTYMADTDYEASSSLDFACDYDRGNPDGDLFLLNHFITNIVPQPDSANLINRKEFLLPRAKGCRDAHNRIPNFVMVDFYDKGDVVEVVNILNGVGE